MSTLHERRRVAHELVLRDVTVAAVEDLSPRMRRVHLEGESLRGFTSIAADDHIAILIPGEDGEYIKRHYTPRSFDPESLRLTIDFALHEAGPATDWALSADVGTPLRLGGPRGSFVVEDDFDWYLLIGDETAWPAIARHLERLREDVPVFTIGLIHDEDEIQTASRACDWRPRWLPRGEPSTDDASLVLAMLSTLELPEGDGYVWIAGESGTTQAIRSALIERGHPREWLYASGYWKQGVSDVHDKFE